MRYEYKTENVCSQVISFDIDDNVVTNIEFYGGCNGNLKAISKLLEGATVETIEEKLLGNTCGRRPRCTARFIMGGLVNSKPIIVQITPSM